MPARTAKLEGREHLIVPTVMLTVGVHNGSRGALYYPSEELAKTAARWSGKPVVILHPDGSAGRPDVFERQRVGTIFNASFDGSRLKADLWLDVQRLSDLSPLTLDAIRSGKTVEVSTGLWSDAEAPGGTFSGKDFAATVYNIQPDHLAILPDRVGACSIRDGCGMLRNESSGLSLPAMAF